MFKFAKCGIPGLSSGLVSGLDKGNLAVWRTHVFDMLVLICYIYKFTCMPFGLSNVGASFCHLMEMCLGDQQYITLLFYLHDICVFSSTIDEMLNRVS